MSGKIWEIVVMVARVGETPILRYQYEDKLPSDSLCLWVGRGDQLVWRCPISEERENPFTIHFSPVSPLVNAVVLNNGEREGTIRTDVTLGRYKCFVAVYWEGQIVTDDPDIIIDPRRR